MGRDHPLPLAPLLPRPVDLGGQNVPERSPGDLPRRYVVRPLSVDPVRERPPSPPLPCPMLSSPSRGFSPRQRFHLPRCLAPPRLPLEILQTPAGAPPPPR